MNNQISGEHKEWGRIRLLANLRRDQVASLAGISARRYAALERGTAVPLPDERAAIVRVLTNPVTKWKRMRSAAGLPQVMVANLAGLLVDRLDDIEAGRDQPSDIERSALMAVLVGPAEPQLVGSRLDAAIMETVDAAAKAKGVELTSDLVRDLARILAKVVTSGLEQTFVESVPPTHRDDGRAYPDRPDQDAAAPDEVPR